MSIPKEIKIQNHILPDEPGVYFYYDYTGMLLYIGKATSLKKRVGSYFTKAHNERIAELVSRIARIDYIQTASVLEALILEANHIRAKQPYYNVLLKDDKTHLFLCITHEDFPKPILMRGLDLERFGVKPFARTLTKEAKKKYLAIYGPYTSGYALKKALDYVRKFIPWTICEPPEKTGKTRACFYRHLGQCPGVCTGEITKGEYRRIIRDLISFFEGKKDILARRLEKEMHVHAKKKEFEQASVLRNRLFQLQHIRDVALIQKSDIELPFASALSKTKIDLFGRIEAYDISNISGTSAVGVMTVFEEGLPAKSQYRVFHIRGVKGANDYAMMEEVIRRRVKRGLQYPQAWPFPAIMVIDGGKGQVGIVQKVLNEFQLSIPIIGLAKGYDRKQDMLIFDRKNKDILAIAERGKELFQKVRDEAHRFSVKHHRKLRGKRFGLVI